MNGIFRVGILSTFAYDTCSSHWQCGFDSVCCKTVFSPVFRCRKLYFTTGQTRSCSGYYCTRESDCGRELCCESNRCSQCTDSCVTHSECGEWQSCCKGRWWKPNRCRYTCLYEPCAANSGCGIDECCRYRRCVYCSEPGCTADYHCPTGQHCCDQHFYPKSKCRSQCSGGNCTSDKDCTLSARCDSYKCVDRDKCESRANCSQGWFCCKANWDDNTAYCRQNCIGNTCIDDSDCGLPEECCSNSRCLKCGASCRSSSDCFNSAVCCKGSSFGDNKCSSKCDEESCIVSTDCVIPARWCLGGICSEANATKPCNHTSDCIRSDGKQHYCCTDEISGLKSCNSSCIGQPCSSNHNCTSPNQCCNSHGSCATSGCAWQFPRWLFGLIIAVAVLLVVTVIWCYSRRKIKQLNRCRSDQNTVQMFPGGDGESTQNIHHDPSNEMQVPSSAGLDEPSSPPPSYALSNASTNTAGNRNIPPPPYSFNDETASPELNNEPPPRYRVIQL